MPLPSLNAVAFGIHIVVAMGLTGHILLTKARPASVLLWIGLVWTFPFFGLVGYAFLGRDELPSSAGTAKAVEIALRRADAAAGGGRPEVEWPLFPEATQAPPRTGNQVDLLVDGDAFYPALFEAIDGARETINIQSFIIAGDAVATEMLERCARAHQRGVLVRILYDRLGSTAAHFTGFFRSARAAGLHTWSVSEVWPLRGRFFVNMRNHRKVAVIDGEVGFVGGINLSRDNQGHGSRPAAIRDYHTRVAGPVVADLQAVFLIDWYRATGDTGPLEAAESFVPLAPRGPSTAQVVSGSPLPDGSDLAETIFTCLVIAKRRLVLVTPYFVPDEPTFEAILNASRRGVDVTLIVPRDGNHWYVTRATRSLFERLLVAGVRIWTRRPPFLHAKLLLVDDRFVLLGSANLDYRSLHLNFEANLFIDDRDFASRCDRQVTAELASSEEVTLEQIRAASLPNRLADRACYLLQPLL